MKATTSAFAIFELLLACLIWGFGFVAAVWALRWQGPLTVTALRMTLALIPMASLLWLRPFVQRESLANKHPNGSKVLRWRPDFTQLKLAFWPGLFLSATLILQTWGLKYTTATKSGFITALYVLMVPLIEILWLRRSFTIRHWTAVAFGLAGTLMICELGVSAELGLNLGDALTFLCAITASFQIFWFALISEKIKSSFEFNFYQTFWAAVPALILAPLFERWAPWQTVADASQASAKLVAATGGAQSAIAVALALPAVSVLLPLLGLFSLVMGSQLIAFFLQVRAQKLISPSTAALVYLLESPIAAGFAIVFLGETFSQRQGVGAALILLAVLLVIFKNPSKQST